MNVSLEGVGSIYSMLIVAGSETIGTTLSGSTNHSIQNTKQLQTLVSEVRGTFKIESQIAFAATKDLPFLNAVVLEDLRMCNPVPAGIPRLGPQRGDTVCGHALPQCARAYSIREDEQLLIDLPRLTYLYIRSPSLFLRQTSIKPIPSYQLVGYPKPLAPKNSRTIGATWCRLLAWAPEVVWVRIWSGHKYGSC